MVAENAGIYHWLAVALPPRSLADHISELLRSLLLDFGASLGRPLHGRDIKTWLRPQGDWAMPLLLASQGAKFMATIKKANDRIVASFEITLQTGQKTESESNAQMFDTAAEAEAWLHQVATLRGFES